MNELLNSDLEQGLVEDQAQPALRLSNVVRRYREGEGHLEILRGAEASLWPGQAVALVAPSGAGKSTLLHIAGLLERPDGGEVEIEGRPTSAMKDGERTACGARKSASSTRCIICCRNSPRWKMS